ncbi:hypothetical protein DFH06DRAFT_617709 [Mycena polygramma]|nr:hypothetical protein DFH06DRAFT_617709 [Mycena polygramma]
MSSSTSSTTVPMFSSALAHDPMKASKSLMKYNDKMTHWFSELYAILPAELAPNKFADYKILTRRISMLETAYEYIISLMNELASLTEPESTSPPLVPPPTVFNVFGERKDQFKEIILRLKTILNVADIKNFTNAETAEAAHVQIKDLRKEIERARDPSAEVVRAPAKRLGKTRGVRRTVVELRKVRCDVRRALLLPVPPATDDDATLESAATTDSRKPENSADGETAAPTGPICRTTATSADRSGVRDAASVRAVSDEATADDAPAEVTVYTSADGAQYLSAVRDAVSVRTVPLHSDIGEAREGAPKGTIFAKIYTDRFGAHHTRRLRDPVSVRIAALHPQPQRRANAPEPTYTSVFSATADFVRPSPEPSRLPLWLQKAVPKSFDPVAISKFYEKKELARQMDIMAREMRDFAISQGMGRTEAPQWSPE